MGYYQHGDIKRIKGHLHVWVDDIRPVVLGNWIFDPRERWTPEQREFYDRQQRQFDEWGHTYEPSHSGWYPVSFEGENI